jgi:hypothetical protein
MCGWPAGTEVLNARTTLGMTSTRMLSTRNATSSRRPTRRRRSNSDSGIVVT